MDIQNRCELNRSLNPVSLERFQRARVGELRSEPISLSFAFVKFVEVALPVPVNRQYTYGVPDHMQETLERGHGVVVPFGKRTLTGIVTDVSTASPDFETKAVIDSVDDEALLTDEQLELTKWIAEYYLCTWGEAARASLPPGLDTVSEYRVRKHDSRAGKSPTEFERRVLDALPSDSSISVAALRQRIADVTLGRLRTLQKKGLIGLEENLTRPRSRIRTVKYISLQSDQPTDRLRGTKQLAVIEALKRADGLLQPELLSKTGASSSTINRLEQLGHLRIENRVIDRSEMVDDSSPAGPVHELNEAQQNALDALVSGADLHQYRTFLLHGITGSGKTEVYLETLRHIRSIGKSAIILVPEISLTPQTVRRFRSRFPGEIAVLHSRMSPGERFDSWRGIRSGKYPIVVGPRSAILAPVSNLGLIVVDEEHEASYKQFDPAPRYNARDVAVIRARLNDAICVLGSATPSLETFENAQIGKYSLLELPERIETTKRKAVLPDIRIVDMRSERDEYAENTLSAPLREMIGDRLESGQQIILLQNRRGYAPTVRCSNCGWDPECRDCSVSMTFHKAKRHLRCHYCGRTSRLPRSCPACGNALLQLGIGTQRVEEELKVSFPDANVVRMDLDTTAGKNTHHKILTEFSEGKYDILLGTQMVAKGLDFERVTLVGVIDADAGLTLPDIRAEERTFHLLTQVAGRAGRADLPGEVVFQTRNPGHRVIQHALRHDYRGFVREILAEREALSYPPHGKLVAVLFSGPDERGLTNLANRWVQQASAIAPHLQLLGPSASFIGKVRNRFRMQVIVKSGSADAHSRARRTIRKIEEGFKIPGGGYRIAIDVDPAGLL